MCRWLERIWFAGWSKCSVQFSSVTQSCLTLCDPMDCSTPGFPVHHQLLELAQTHVHWMSVQPWSISVFLLIAFINSVEKETGDSHTCSFRKFGYVLDISPDSRPDWPLVLNVTGGGPASSKRILLFIKYRINSDAFKCLFCFFFFTKKKFARVKYLYSILVFLFRVNRNVWKCNILILYHSALMATWILCRATSLFIVFLKIMKCHAFFFLFSSLWCLHTDSVSRHSRLLVKKWLKIFFF